MERWDQVLFGKIAEEGLGRFRKDVMALPSPLEKIENAFPADVQVLVGRDVYQARRIFGRAGAVPPYREAPALSLRFQ